MAPDIVVLRQPSPPQTPADPIIHQARRLSRRTPVPHQPPPAGKSWRIAAGHAPRAARLESHHMHSSYPRRSALSVLRTTALCLCATVLLAACNAEGLDGAGDTINSSSGSGNGSIGGGSSGGVAKGTYSIGGTINGLSGSGLVLAVNGGNALTITGNGGFPFSNRIASGGAYSVTIQSQPIDPTQICSVANGAGTVSTVNIYSVTVSCTTNFYTVSGTVSNLVGSGLVLQTNGSNNVAVATSGTYTLATLASGSNYTVTVMTQPTSPSQTCTLANDAGMVTGANVTNVAISCTTNNYTVGGSVTGLTGSGLVIQTNGANNVSVPAAGSYVFAPLPSGSAYAVTVLSQPTNPAQTCTVANGTGTLVSANYDQVPVTCIDNGHTVGGTVSGLTGSGLVLQDNGGDNLAISANGGFTFATPVAEGAPYAVTVLTQPLTPAQHCTVTNGTGTMGMISITGVTVTCRTDGRYAFVPDSTLNNISAFTIDSTTGSLALVNSVPTDTDPNAVAVTPNGQFVYTTNGGASDISIFSVNAATGALTAAGAASTGAGSEPLSITIDPSGKFALATAGANGTVVVFSINPGTGALAQVPGSPFPTAAAPAGNPSSVIVDPSDRFVYVTDQFVPAIDSYTFNATTGDLTPLPSSPSAAGNNPVWVSIDPTGKFLYVSNQTDGNVSGWTINGAGALGAMAGSPYGAGFAGGANPVVNTIDPTGRFMYVTDVINDQVVAFTIDQTTGVLSPMAGSPFATGNGPFGEAIDPSGQFLYVSNTYDGTISMFTVDVTTGALTAVPGSPRVYGGSAPGEIAIE